jgi:hypothetical protein
MEEDLRKRILRQHRTDRLVQERLELAIEKAQENIDTEASENPELRFALEIVERFLKKKKRVCYGGTAINAQLPKEMKFYSDTKDLPDYDFFTPNLYGDIKELMEDLQRSGFEDVQERVGVHEGTKKILVNYVPIADISEMDDVIYETILKRAVNINGINYTDPDILRMMMYLEMSHPKGMVSRWDKVFERLSLINTAFPIKKCEIETRAPKSIPFIIRDKINQFCVQNKRILAGARLENLYLKSLTEKKVYWETRKGGAVVFFSPNIKDDALAIKKMLGIKGIDIEYFKAKGDLVPPRLVVSLNKESIALIIQETACHGYNTLTTKDGQEVFIASLENLITLYLSLSIFTEDEKNIFGFSLLCAVGQFIRVNNVIQRTKTIRQFSPFPLKCRGYQKGFPTLLREKASRVAKAKAVDKLKKILHNTRKNNAKRGTTRKKLSNLTLKDLGIKL